MSMSRMSRWMIIGACLLGSLQAHAAVPGQQYRLNVPAQSVYDALKAFAVQTSLQVVYYSEVAQGAASPGVSGELDAAEALKEILKGTGLTFQFLNERTVAIRQEGSTSGEAVSSAGQDAEQTMRLAQLPSAASGDADQEEANKGASSEPGERARDSGVEEIIVTAQKREERLIEVPQAVTVISGEANWRGLGMPALLQPRTVGIVVGTRF